MQSPEPRTRQVYFASLHGFLRLDHGRGLRRGRRVRRRNQDGSMRAAFMPATTRMASRNAYFFSRRSRRIG